MIITFCGHAHFQEKEEYRKKILDFLEERVGEQEAYMYLGDYGEFDSFAYDCCKRYKERHPKTSLVFVTPYFTQGYQKNHLEIQKLRYDLIVYPEIETKPPKFAIVYRNKYMVDCADCVVAFVNHSWGGAYNTYQYAKKKGKEILNLADCL